MGTSNKNLPASQQNGIAKNGESGVSPHQIFQDFFPTDQFVRHVLNKEPEQDHVKKNDLAGGALYLPIGKIEMTLDEVFMGLWKTDNFRWTVIANEVVGSIDLHVYHPIIKDWLTRTGAAATIIQQDAYKKDDNGNYMKDERGYKIRANVAPSDVDAKIKNALEKGFPKLKAECIKNAAKGLGKLFGRDLNRTFDASGYHASRLGEIQKVAQLPKLQQPAFEAALERIKKGEQGLAEKLQQFFTLTPQQQEAIEAAEKTNSNG